MESLASNPQLAGPLNPDKLDVAYRIKSDQELRLAYWLFKMMDSPMLVKLGSRFSCWALRLGLPIKTLIRRTIYQHFCGGETAEESLQVVRRLSEAGVQSVLDYAAEAQENEADFEIVLQEILNNIKLAQESHAFHYISLKLTGLGYKAIFEKLHSKIALSPEEQEAFHRTETRLDDICHAAALADITVYIDAEESWMQDPMDALAEKMMRRYNRQRAVVFNTLQMYRIDRIPYLQACIERFADSSVILGIKLVRGAYLEKEQQRAEEMGYQSPVFFQKSHTDQAFDRALDICLAQLDRLELCAATHNEQSLLYLSQRIRDEKIYDHRQRIHFSQLYGMSDNLSFNLADAGYNVSKYVPYGDVVTTLPYLIRRAEENTSISGQMNRELSLLKLELRRRQLK